LNISLREVGLVVPTAQLEQAKEKLPDDLKTQAEEYSLDKVPRTTAFSSASPASLA
jgi:hypothetical protein